MNEIQKKKNYLPGIITFIVLVGLVYFFAPRAEKIYWYSVIPPLLAVCMAWVTQKLIPSLFIAVVVGGFLSQVPGHETELGAWVAGVKTTGSSIWGTAVDPVNLQIVAFVTAVMGMIGVVIASGGLMGIVRILLKISDSARGTQIATAFMGLAIFIDDYANTMIVGSAMRPVTDEKLISREKLAFLVDATSAPVAGVALVSTWIGYEVGLFDSASKTLALGKDGYSLFFDALGFRFYCFLMLVFVFANVFFNVDFGPMKKAQERAKKGQVIREGATPLTSGAFSAVEADSQAKISAMTAIAPIGLLFFILMIGLWIDGNGLGKMVSFFDLFSFSLWREVISSSENNILILAVAAATGLLVSVLMAVFKGGISCSSAIQAAWKGIKGSFLPNLILILAWSLKAACDSLHTGPFLVHWVDGVLSPLWFPALVFVISGLTAFATGTSWGTMAILIPTAAPIALELDGGTYGLATMITLGAVLDGAIFGDHCSPISDTTIMSSIASSCDHIDHVRTQLPYSLIVAFLALTIGYVPAAMGVSPLVGFLIASLVIIGLFFILKQKQNRLA